ncbi:hypothetical protein CLOM_g11976 [Closterium sp. NIES-68]|nr:hypothetical protein CLOM_g11976 [Closterium sp. NIES-68]
MLEDVNEEEYRVDRMVHQLLPSLLPPPPPACHATVHSNSDAASLRHVGPHQLHVLLLVTAHAMAQGST